MTHGESSIRNIFHDSLIKRKTRQHQLILLKRRADVFILTLAVITLRIVAVKHSLYLDVSEDGNSSHE